jgi:uncharacterized membrane protein (DUF485 family)
MAPEINLLHCAYCPFLYLIETLNMKLNLWPKTATTTKTKIIYLASQLAIVSLFLYCSLSALQLFNNWYAREVNNAPVICHVIGGIAMMLASAGVYSIFTRERNEGFDTRTTTALGLIGVSMFVFPGFFIW